MKVIQMQIWEIEALANNLKSCVRLPLNPQPKKDKTEIWYWKDYCWLEGGFPQFCMKDYSPYQPGDIVEVRNADIYLRILTVRVERLQEITEDSAQKEGCQGVFSGTGATLGSGWKVTPSEEYAKRWDEKSNEMFLVWNFNPWVEVIEFEIISKGEAGADTKCKYCSGKTRISFRCDVRTLRDDGVVEDIPVPSIHCPYCGRVLEKSVV